MAEVKNILIEKTAEIDSWALRASILLALTVAVGLFGAVGGILSQVSRKWAKPVIAVAGACVALLTVIINTAFTVDHRTYRKHSIEAKQIVEEIRIQMAQLAEIPDRKQRNKIINDTILVKFQTITNLGKGLYETSAHYSGMISTAHADELSPEWVTKPPKDARSLYFVGHGIAASLDHAERAATAYAKENAQIYFLDAWKESGLGDAGPGTRRAMQKMIDTADVAKKFVRYDSAQRHFRYFCLLKIDIETAELKMKILASQENGALPSRFMEYIRKDNAP